MGKRIETKTEECGCVSTSWYAWSECGNFDDGDSHVDFCDWHELTDAAFSTWIDRRNCGLVSWDVTYDEAYWLQIVIREREYDEREYNYQWSYVSFRSLTDADVPF